MSHSPPPATLHSETETSDFGVFQQLLTSSPALYPVAADLQADRVCFVHVTRTAYAAASFLDERMLVPGTRGRWCPWPEVQRAAAGLSGRCHFVFHISHVGSTLLSRLVGHHPALFSLREPAVLRTLAEAHLLLGHPSCPWDQAEFDRRLAVYLALWSRTFEPGQVAVIKATSFVSEMAQLLMDRVADARSILMFVPPKTFLAALLGGAMSDITAAAGQRLFRLHRRLGAALWKPGSLSPGESVAMSWLSEMLALHAAATRFPDRVLWVDFDRFLTDPGSGLAAVLTHLGAGCVDETVPAILARPTLGEYAKAPGQKFDAQFRHRLLRQDEERHAAEIRKGLDWLDRAASIPVVRMVLERVAALSGGTGQTKS